MLRALLERGWVERRRDGQDRRTWRVSLTAAGEQVIRGARRLLLRAVQRMVIGAMGLSLCRSPDKRFLALVTFTDYLDALRHDFADRATLEYPWWPTPFDH